MHPYCTNPIRDTLGRTRNWRDSLNIFEDSHGPEGKYNPVFKLDLLGGVLSQGLMGYITMVSVCFLFFNSVEGKVLMYCALGCERECYV
jgi:hypothetical protein